VTSFRSVPAFSKSRQEIRVDDVAGNEVGALLAATVAGVDQDDEIADADHVGVPAEVRAADGGGAPHIRIGHPAAAVRTSRSVTAGNIMAKGRARPSISNTLSTVTVPNRCCGLRALPESLIPT